MNMILYIDIIKNLLWKYLYVVNRFILCVLIFIIITANYERKWKTNNTTLWEQFLKSNRKIIERGQIDTPNT